MSNGGIPSTNEIIRELNAQGWRVEQTRRGHYQAFAPDGRTRATFADTTEPRAMKNNLADLRRSGQFMWPPPDRKRPQTNGAPPVNAPPKPAPVKRDLEALFRDLRDAKSELLAAEKRHEETLVAVRKAEALLVEAQETARRSHEEVDLAKKLMMEAKAEFDETFEGDAA